MDTHDVRALADILEEYSLTSLEFVDGEKKIKLEKSRPQGQEAAAPQKIREKAESAAGDLSMLNFNNLAEVRSPIVGVFYDAPSPDAQPFVKIGSKVKKGDVLCIIETMKIMNEIASEYDGEIADICIKNEEVAEFGQVLFKIF